MTIKGGRKRNWKIQQISFGNPFSFETLITSSIIRFPNFSSLNSGLTYIIFISPEASLIFLKLIVPAIWPSTSTKNNQLHIRIWGLQYRMIFLKFPIYLRRTKTVFTRMYLYRWCSHNIKKSSKYSQNWKQNKITKVRLSPQPNSNYDSWW